MITTLEKIKRSLFVFVVALLFIYSTSTHAEQRKGIGINLNNFLKEINRVGEHTDITLNRMFMLPFDYNKESTAIQKDFYAYVNLKIVSHKSDEQVYLMIVTLDYEPQLIESKEEYKKRVFFNSEVFTRVVFTMIRAANADTLTKEELFNLYFGKLDLEGIYLNGGMKEYSTRFHKYSLENNTDTLKLIFKIEGLLSI